MKVKRPPRLSLRKAINEKCKECIYDDSPGNGNWRQQVTACTAKTCPLYRVRPLSSQKGEKNGLKGTGAKQCT